jgi:hypothetical protein
VIAVALIPIVVVGIVILVVVSLLQQRGTEGPGTLLRTYLYIASLAGVVTLAFGLVGLVDAVLAAALGTTFVYGGQSATTAGVTDTRAAEDAVRGVTFSIFGALFWFVHWLGRKRAAGGDAGSQYRAYVLVGAAAFGIATIAFVPSGVYQALSNWLVARGPGDTYRAAVGEPLASGIVSLAIWLLYLRAALAAARQPAVQSVEPALTSGTAR